jgi:hypothetical protein
VIRLLGDLEPDGRMARVLVAVPDPLDLGRPADDRMPLLIGDYVRVEIHGRRIDGVYRIPRSALRDNTRVWVATDQDRLSIRTVAVAWRDAETVLVQRGVAPGERLIISDLPAPVAGMALRIKGESPEKTAPARPQEPAA